MSLEAFMSKIGVPSRLHSVTIGDLPEGMPSRLKKLNESMNDKDMSVLFVEGLPSKVKEQTISFITKMLLSRGTIRTASYITNINESDLAPVRLYIVMNTDMASHKTVEAIREVIMPRLQAGCIFIIDCTTVEKFSDKFGAELTDYMMQSALMFEVNYVSGE